MIFKEEHIREEFWKCHAKIRLLLCEADHLAVSSNEQIVVTEIFRTDEEQKKFFETGVSKRRFSVHNFGRGADVRYVQGLSERIADFLNAKYPYSTKPEKQGTPTALIHDGTFKHLHLQVES